MTKRRATYRRPDPRTPARHGQPERYAQLRADAGPVAPAANAPGLDRPQSRDLRPEQTRRDPSTQAGLSGFPPNFGEYPFPHVISFQGVIATIARTYRPSDEAVQDSWDNARFMLNDLTITECLEQRKRSVALLDWRIEPEDTDNPRHKELAADMTAIVKNTPFFTKYRECLQNALWFGKYGIKHRFRWHSIRGRRRVVIDRWEPVHGDKIVFRYDDGSKDYDPDQIGIRVGAGFTSSPGIAQRWGQDQLSKVQVADYGLAYFLDPWERPMMAIHKHIIEDGEYEVPLSAGRIHGVGIRHRIYWNWYQKQELQAFLMEFLERSSTGIEIWYYPYGNADAELKTRKAAEERIGQGRNIILVPRPIGEEMAYGVERIEPGMAGAESLKAIIKEEYGDRIKRYILGQTLTTEASATGLGSNLASIHLDTYLQIVRYDATNQEETLTRELVQPLLRFNFPAQADVPLHFKLNTESPDVEGKLGAWQKAYQMGCRLKESQVMDLIGAQAPEDDETPLVDPQIQKARQEIEASAQAAAQQVAGQASGAQVQGWRPSTPEENVALLTQLLGVQAHGENGETVPGAAIANAAQHVDQLSGGVGDQTDPAQLPREALKVGTREEMEHTADPAVAMDIAIDHLTEDPHYYDDVAATPENSERVRAVHYCLADEAIEVAAALMIGMRSDRQKIVYVLHPATGEVERHEARYGNVTSEKYTKPGKGQRSFDWDEQDHPRDDGGKFTEKENAGHGKSQGTADDKRNPASAPTATAKPMSGGVPALPHGATEGPRKGHASPEGGSGPGDKEPDPTDAELSRYDAYKSLMQSAGFSVRSFEDWVANFREVQARRKADETPQKSTEEGSEPKKPFIPEAQPQPKADETPRDFSKRLFEDQNEQQYAFARKSAVANAGEDLLGSARHKANAWRGLEAAEENGTAEELVTRANLLKNEPHNLMVSTARNPLAALAMFYALRNFPPKPGYGKASKAAGADDEAKKVRRQYVEAYQSVKAKAESLAAGTDDPREALDALQGHVRNLITRLRGQKGSDYTSQVTASDRYNETANGLIKLLKACNTFRGSIFNQVGEFVTAFKERYPSLPPDELVEKTADHVGEILDGASLNETFGKKGTAKKGFNAADLYVKTARREGGPQLDVGTPDKAKQYLLGGLKMKGVQFGNYVSDEEREHHLTKCSEALGDLADILSVPKEYISWKGKLGIAFGARGTGNAAAHYEPSSQVINLTRTGGAGSLAHEWGHFFDHALGGLGVSRGDPDKARASGEYASEDYSPKNFVRNAEGQWEKDQRGQMKVVDRSDDLIWKAMDAVRKAWKSSGFERRLKTATHDAVKDGDLSEGKKKYFDSTREVFARSFERHVQRKLEKSGRQNTYLAGLTPQAWEARGMAFWPTDEETDAHAAAFDALLEAFRQGVAKGRYAMSTSGRLVLRQPG